MDHFEQDLARMMRDSRQDTPYEDRHRQRLRVAVRARQRSRTAWLATGSALAVAGLGVGLMVLASSVAQGGTTPRPHPVTSAESVPGPPVVRPASTAEEGAKPAFTPTTRPLPMPYRPTMSGKPST
ncbi:hypothetical protein [Streptomyces turgidiscabies]|uniref:Cellulase n=1 Tax=Streptomyces turgidiscabies TaxID=85558 RepID=A0ABU0RVX1_9ACTN|nr:hypothetical protein [Streptomyces turgidiscabies]MDQ0936142.1 hypothetical protein [Streptomyces turgidiscabies]